MDLQSIIDTSRTRVSWIMGRDGMPGASVALVRGGDGAFHPARGLEMAWLEFGDGSYFDYNDGDRDARGSIGDRYDDFLGSYDIVQWGNTVAKRSLRKKNGYLYLGKMRMVEHSPGLLFSGDGEALDLRGWTPTFRNIMLLSAERSLRFQPSSAAGDRKHGAG